jgi:hypothetical protein
MQSPHPLTFIIGVRPIVLVWGQIARCNMPPVNKYSSCIRPQWCPDLGSGTDVVSIECSHSSTRVPHTLFADVQNNMPPVNEYTFHACVRTWPGGTNICPTSAQNYWMWHRHGCGNLKPTKPNQQQAWVEGGRKYRGLIVVICRPWTDKGIMLNRKVIIHVGEKEITQPVDSKMAGLCNSEGNRFVVM